MQLCLDDSRLSFGAEQLDKGVFKLPKDGGGIRIPELVSTKERYVNIDICVEEDHSMAFELRVYDRQGERKVTIRFGVMPHYATSISLDLNWLDGHILYPGHTPGELKTVCHGSRIERDKIGKAEIISIPCYHDTHVKFENLEISDHPREAKTPPDLHLLDEMGQFIPKTWDGKTSSMQEMIDRLHEQYSAENDWPFKDRTRWGGFAALKISEATGFFHAVRTNERWMIADPDGYAFFSLGADCVAARCDARLDPGFPEHSTMKS